MIKNILGHGCFNGVLRCRLFAVNVSAKERGGEKEKKILKMDNGNYNFLVNFVEKKNPKHNR